MSKQEDLITLLPTIKRKNKKKREKNIKKKITLVYTIKLQLKNLI